MNKVVLALIISFMTQGALAQENDPAMQMCGALTQIQNSKISDIEQVEGSLLKELKNKEAGIKNEKLIFELSEKLDALRIEMRQLDQELKDVCN